MINAESSASGREVPPQASHYGERRDIAGRAGWNSQRVAAPDTTFLNPSVAQVGNSTVIAASGPDGLDLYWQPIGGSGWHCQVVPSGSC